MKDIQTEGLQRYNRYLRRKKTALLAAVIATLLAALYAMGVGSIRIPAADVLRVLFGGGEDLHRTAVLNIRLPRAVTAILVGAALASAGAVMQCVLRNPLASASSLGVSQGAAFGAALGIVAFGGGVVSSASAATAITIDNPYIVTLCAFVFGMISTVVVVGISQLKKDIGPGGLILADLVSRVVMAPVILPIGALTAFLGAPVFLFLLFKGGKPRA